MNKRIFIQKIDSHLSTLRFRYDLFMLQKLFQTYLYLYTIYIIYIYIYTYSLITA
jgi:hypothetical protein